MKNKKGLKIHSFIWSLLVILFVFNFIGKAFGVSHFSWHLFLHAGIIVFCFFVLIYSLNLNEKAMRDVILGSVLWIVVESILILSHIFEEYYCLNANLILWFVSIFGILMIMKGFKEAVK